jgi:hypothetical protein
MRTFRLVALIYPLLGVVLPSCSIQSTTAMQSLKEETRPDVAELLTQVQSAINTDQALDSKSKCHYIHPPTGRRYQSEREGFVGSFLKMNASNVHRFEYFPSDGVAEIGLSATNPEVVISLYIQTKELNCETFEIYVVLD